MSEREEEIDEFDDLDVPAAETGEPGEPGEPGESDESDEPGESQTNDRVDEPDGSAGIGVSGRDVRAYVEWGAFAICALFAVIAALQLYLSVDQLVSIWIADEFQPAFRAAFNLAVLLLAGYGAFTLAERLNE